MRRLLALALCVLLAGGAAARDDGRYAGSPLKDWFNGLRSPAGGLCCDMSDGHRIDDVDWGTADDGHYWVMIDGEKVDVPPDRVVPGANRLGPAIVWPMYVAGKPIARCFMPGAWG